MDNESRLARIHDRWLDPPEPKAVRKCDTCLDDIVEGEVVLVCENGDIINEECKDDWIEENISFDRRQA